jgi:hypothetical protein
MDAVISEKDGKADRWGDDYFNRRPPKNNFLLTLSSRIDQVVGTILSAINSAGNTGTLIFDVGHGTSLPNNSMDDSVELAPGGKLTLGGRIVRTSS